MMALENIQIQLIDTPPLTPPSIEWWFRHILIWADTLLIAVDLNDAPLTQMEDITTQLEKTRIAVESGKVKKQDTKTLRQKPECNVPVILKRWSTLEDAAADIHKDFARKLKYARIWGFGRHDGLMIKRDHILQDVDIIELQL